MGKVRVWARRVLSTTCAPIDAINSIAIAISYVLVLQVATEGDGLGGVKDGMPSGRGGTMIGPRWHTDEEARRVELRRAQTPEQHTVP